MVVNQGSGNRVSQSDSTLDLLVMFRNISSPHTVSVFFFVSYASVPFGELDLFPMHRAAPGYIIFLI